MTITIPGAKIFPYKPEDTAVNKIEIDYSGAHLGTLFSPTITIKNKSGQPLGVVNYDGDKSIGKVIDDLAHRVLGKKVDFSA
ncbi:MAG: hypothetical protein WCG23_05735 [bacterium]